jgi:acetyl esterase/lipase
MPHNFARTLLALPIALLLGACSRLEFAAVNLRVDQSAVQSVAFDPEHGLSLDVHRARGVSDKAPVVVFLYGGDWRKGRRQDYRFVGQSLAKAGLLVFVPDYRKFPQVTFPAFVEDAARSVAWARRHAAEYGGDPSRIFLVGHSAGAHIAAMLATDARFLQAVGMRPRDLAGVVGLSGPYDFLPLTDPDLQEVFAPEARWAQTQPVNFVDGDEPPFLLFQGTADTTVRPHNSVSLVAKLRSVGEPVQLQMMDGTGHAGTLLDLVRNRNGVRMQTLQFVGGRAQ